MQTCIKITQNVYSTLKLLVKIEKERRKVCGVHVTGNLNGVIF